MRTTNGFDSRVHCDRRRYQYSIPAWVMDPAYDVAGGSWWEANGARLDGGDRAWREEDAFPAERRALAHRLLGQYRGTHNFHNFTVDIDGDDPSAKRHILSFGVKDVIDVGGVPHVRMEVVGQSFMLHQIRKLVGMVSARPSARGPRGAGGRGSRGEDERNISSSTDPILGRAILLSSGEPSC